MVLPALIAGGAALLGGWMSSKSSKKQADNANRLQLDNALRQEKLQKEFAQSGIQWRVEDAKKAGVHPLYALGAQTMSYSPTLVNPQVGDTSGIAAGFAQAGQEFGGAIQRSQDPARKIAAMQVTAQQLQLENMSLQNELLASQIAKLNAAPSPGIPVGDSDYLITGQGQTLTGPAGALKEEFKRSPSRWGFNSQELATIPDVGFARTNEPGRFAMLPSSDAKQRMEDMIIPEIQWWIRNQLMPLFYKDRRNHPIKPGPGEEIVINPITGESWIEKKRH